MSDAPFPEDANKKFESNPCCLVPCKGEVGDVIVGGVAPPQARLFGSNGHGSKKITLYALYT